MLTFLRRKEILGILIGFILVIGLLLSLAGVGLYYLRAMQRTIDDLSQQYSAKAQAATEMYIVARERALLLVAILQEKDPFARDAMVPRFYTLAGKFRKARNRFAALPLSPQEKSMLAEQGKLTAKGAELQNQVLDLAQQYEDAAAERLLAEKAIPAQDLATNEMRRLVDWQIGAERRAVTVSQGQYRFAFSLMAGSASLAIFLSAGIAGLVIRRQSRLLTTLHDRERDTRILLENIPVPVWFKDLEARIGWFNQGFERLAGRPAADIAGCEEADLWGRIEGLRGKLEDQRVLETGKSASQDINLSDEDGETHHHLVTRTPIPAATGGWKGVLCVARDLTPMERMNELLLGTNQELQSQKTALDEHAIVSIADTAGNITYVNDKFCAISGYGREELIGKNQRIVNSGQHPHAFFADLWQSVTRGRVWRGEVCNRSKDGSHFWVDSTIVPFLDAGGLPYQYVSIYTDITARKHLEASLQDSNVELQKRVDRRTADLSRAMGELEAKYRQLEALHRQLQEAQGQLLQSEKLASIGQLAAGVAHEINNPIGFVHSNLGTLENYIRDLMRMIEAYESAERTLTVDVPACAEVAELRRKLDLAYLKEDIPALMSESREGITRVRKIIQDLKDFSRLDGSPEWQYADLHKGLDSTLNIVHNEIKYRADVVKEYGDLPEIECLPSQISQVFMNLLINAAHAIEGPRGTITLRTGRRGDDSVWLEVGDTGKGIPEELRGRIFDPFFTTKPVGQGTGLGLSLAYGIIQKHNGEVEVESEPGRGSIFRIVLPIRHVNSDSETVAPSREAVS